MRRTLYAISGLSCAAVLAFQWSLGIPASAQNADSEPSGNGDTNGNGAIEIGDAIYLLNWLFSDGPAPVPIVCDGSGEAPAAEQAVRLRQQAASELKLDAVRAGQTFDEKNVDIVLLPGGGYVAHALVRPLSDIQPKELAQGLRVGIIRVERPTAARGLPSGFYVHWMKFDLAGFERGDREAFVNEMIDASGKRLTVPDHAVRIPGDHPASTGGARQTLTADRTRAAAKKYVSCPDIDELALWCFEVTI